MSSTYVRTQIKNFITTNLASENQVDLTGEYDDLVDVVLPAYSVEPLDPWLGLQFVGSTESPISITSNNSTGKYREIGSVFLHVVDIAKPDVRDGILTRCETIRDTLRGQRIGDIIVEDVSPANFESGATLDFESGYIAASVILNYYRDLDL